MMCSCIECIGDQPEPTQDEIDAARYRWLRGGPEIPQHSTRWPRWEVRYWDGRHWQTLFAEQLDSAIDAAISHETPNTKYAER